jgi:hydroxypyruvate isomerase
VIPDRFAANVAWLFAEHAWPDRFEAARRAGFGAVEFPWPDDPATTARAVRSAGLRVALLNAPAGDLEAGERGWPNDPHRIDEWRDAFESALGMARTVGCPRVNVLAGNHVAGAAPDEELACLEGNLRWALGAAAKRGIGVVTELLNRRENPDYLLATLDEAWPLLERLAPYGWQLQLDTWHLGLTEPDVPGAIQGAAAHIGHIQVADLPDRRAPGSGTLDWAAIGVALRGVDYRGSIGLEYRSAQGFEWTDGLRALDRP